MTRSCSDLTASDVDATVEGVLSAVTVELGDGAAGETGAGESDCGARADTLALGAGPGVATSMTGVDGEDGDFRTGCEPQLMQCDDRKHNNHTFMCVAVLFLCSCVLMCSCTYVLVWCAWCVP